MAQFQRLFFLGLLLTISFAEPEPDPDPEEVKEPEGSEWIYMPTPNDTGANKNMEARTIFEAPLNGDAGTLHSNQGFAAAGGNAGSGPGGSFANSFAASGTISQDLKLTIQRRCGICPNVPPSHFGNCSPGEYPWIVSIFTWNNRFICSGVLISNSIIITTASKILKYSDSRQPLIAYLGAYSIPEYDPTVLPQKKSYISAAVIHPEYNENDPTHDIALLRLSQDCDFDLHPYYFPICISLSDTDYTSPSTCKVVGWPDIRPDWSGNNIFLTNGVVQTSLDGCQFGDHRYPCAKGGVCVGNSGSAVMCHVGDNRYFLWGLVVEDQTCDRNSEGTCPVASINNNLPFIQKYIYSNNPSTTVRFQ